MPLLSLRQAAAQAHASKSTLLRSIRSGQLSASRDIDGSYRIDPAELSRAFPPDRVKLRATEKNGAGFGAGGAADAVRAAAMEAENRGLRELLDAEKRHAETWRSQAEHWRGQAERLLLAAPVIVTPAPTSAPTPTAPDPTPTAPAPTTQPIQSAAPSPSSWLGWWRRRAS